MINSTKYLEWLQHVPLCESVDHSAVAAVVLVNHIPDSTGGGGHGSDENRRVGHVPKHWKAKVNLNTGNRFRA